MSTGSYGYYYEHIDREGRMKLLFILGGIVLIVVMNQHFLDSAPTGQSCAAEPLPRCADTNRTGSYVSVNNNCEFDITVQWEFLAGKNQLYDLAPGDHKQVSSFPVKIQSVSCCSESNRCW